MDMKATSERLIEAMAKARRQWQAQQSVATRSWPTGFKPALTIGISRQAGANGAEVAQELGRRLGWPVYDRELLQKVADAMGLRANQVEGLDEKRKGWFEEVLVAVTSGRMVSEMSYARYLLETLFSLAAHGECVLVGRGAPLALPASTTLRVRLVADVEDRVNRIRRNLGLTLAEARHWVENTDRDRAAFTKEHFQKDSSDPLHYDLILNSSRFTVSECADLIVAAMRDFQARTRAESAERAVPVTGPIELRI